jgi:hypothetical protein
MVTRSPVVDQIETRAGAIQVRMRTDTVDEDQEASPVIGFTYARYVLWPGDSLDGQPEEVAAAALAAWGLE